MGIEINNWGKILTETDKTEDKKISLRYCIVNSDVLCLGRDSDLRHTKQPRIRHLPKPPLCLHACSVCPP